MLASDSSDMMLRLVELVVSWPVILMLFAYMFRRDMALALRAIGEWISHGPGGRPGYDVAAVKTVATMLGHTDVSVQPIKATSALFDGLHNTYTNRQHYFQISWSAEHWAVSPVPANAEDRNSAFGLSGAGDVVLTLTRNEAANDYRPLIAVMIEPVGGIPIRRYLELSARNLKQHGWTVLTYGMDVATGGAFVTYVHARNALRYYHFMRVGLHQGRAYIVTTAQLPPEGLFGKQLCDELVAILNSFRIIL